MADEKFEIPEHLKELERYISMMYNYEPEVTNYTRVAFNLVELSDGENKATVKSVAAFVQHQQSDLKNRYEISTDIICIL